MCPNICTSTAVKCRKYRKNASEGSTKILICTAIDDCVYKKTFVDFKADLDKIETKV